MFYNKFEWFSFVYLCLLSMPFTLVAGSFDVGKEFPNFLQEGVDLQQPAEIDKRMRLIDKNIQALLNRVQLPHMQNGQIASDQFFNHLLDYIHTLLPKNDSQIQPKLTLYISGGVVRTLLAFIYKYIYEQKNQCYLKNTKTHWPDTCSTEYLLNKLHKESMSKLMGTFVLGVGSDLDMLFTLSPKDENLEKEIKEKATKFINSAEDYFNLGYYHNPIKKSFVPVGDVKEYESQIGRSLAQGGSLIDTLAFEIMRFERPEERSAKYSYQPVLNVKIKVPDGYERIIRDFLEGSYEYIKGPDLAEDKQSLRGVRPLLELPFLRLKNEEQLVAELMTLLNKVKTNPDALSGKAVEQIEKMVRNAYFGGANNRAYRSPPNSPLAIVLEIAQALRKPEATHSLLPEFALPTSLAQSKPPLQGKFSEQVGQALVPPSEFIEAHTQAGTLFHGTNMLNALAIIRNGFVISNERQGVAAYGPGVYATPDEKFAEGYGFVIQLKVKKKNVRYLDWQKIDLNIKSQLIEEAKTLNFIHVFDLLKAHYAIDVVINTHIIFLNPAALKRPKDLASYLQALTRMGPDFLRANDDIEKFMASLEKHMNLLFLRQFFEGKTADNDSSLCLLDNIVHVNTIIDNVLQKNNNNIPYSLECGFNNILDSILITSNTAFINQAQEIISIVKKLKSHDTLSALKLRIGMLSLQDIVDHIIPLAPELFIDHLDFILDSIRNSSDEEFINCFKIIKTLKNDIYISEALEKRVKKLSFQDIVDHIIPLEPEFCADNLENFYPYKADSYDFTDYLTYIVQTDKFASKKYLDEFKTDYIHKYYLEKYYLKLFSPHISEKLSAILESKPQWISELLIKHLEEDLHHKDFNLKNNSLLIFINNLKKYKLFTPKIRDKINNTLYWNKENKEFYKIVPDFWFLDILSDSKCINSVPSCVKFFKLDHIVDALGLEGSLVGSELWQEKWPELQENFLKIAAHLPLSRLRELAKKLRVLDLAPNSDGEKLRAQIQILATQAHENEQVKKSTDLLKKCHEEMKEKKYTQEYLYWVNKICAEVDSSGEDLSLEELAPTILKPEELNAWEEWRKANPDPYEIDDFVL